MNTQHRPGERPGNAASTTRPRVLAALLVLTAAGGLTLTLAVPGDGAAPPPEGDSAADDAYVAKFEQAQRLLGRGADEEAEKILRELIAEHGDQAPVHHALALLMQFRRRPADATAEFRLAAKLAPTEPVIQRDAGLHLLATGDAAAAEPFLAAAARLAPEDVETAVGQGAACRALGRAAEAEAAYRRALKADGNSVDAAAGLAACVLETNPAEALKLLEKVSGRWADVMLVRGMALLHLGRLAEAAAELRRVVDVVPPGPAGTPFLRGAAESLVLAGAVEPAVAASAKWFEAESAAGGPTDAACVCLAVAREAGADHAGALAAIAASPAMKTGPDALRAPLRLLEAAVLVRSARKDDAARALEVLAGLDADVFERSAARRLLGRLPASEFAPLAAQPGRANDVPWIESLAAEMAGDAEAASAARAQAAAASKPCGEYPGLLVLPPAAK